MCNGDNFVSLFIQYVVKKIIDNILKMPYNDYATISFSYIKE